MGNDGLERFLGEWELALDLPGAENVRGRVVFEPLGSLLVERSTVPDANAPDSICVIAAQSDGTYLQHYFDSRGVVRLYAMTFDGITRTLTRAKPDFSPLEFQQRYIGRFLDDGSAIEGEWQTSMDGDEWHRDFRLFHRRVGS